MMEAFEMELIKRQIDRYIKADRKTKKKMIDEYLRITAIKRKAAIKRFNRFIKPDKFKSEKTSVKRGRPVKYGSLEKELLMKIWELSGYLCAERLICFIRNNKSMLYNTFIHYGSVFDTIITINEGSCKNLISQFPKPKKKRYCKGNIDIYKYVAIDAHFNRFAHYKPGYFEVDFVEHKDSNSSGLYALTLNFADVYSQFISRSSALGKDYQTIRNISQKIIDKIPFDILALHPDNEKGLLKMVYDRANKFNDIICSRSRPYKKDDNSHIEQKNGDKIRKIVGYYRYDTELELSILNRIYELSDLIDNYFIPSFKLKSKIIDEKGRIIRREFLKPQTPYQRIIECKEISEEVKEKMSKIYKSLDYIELKRKRDKLVEELIKMKTGKRTKIMEQEYELCA